MSEQKQDQFEYVIDYDADYSADDAKGDTETLWLFITDRITKKRWHVRSLKGRNGGEVLTLRDSWIKGNGLRAEDFLDSIVILGVEDVPRATNDVLVNVSTWNWNTKSRMRRSGDTLPLSAMRFRDGITRMCALTTSRTWFNPC